MKGICINVWLLYYITAYVYCVLLSCLFFKSRECKKYNIKKDGFKVGVSWKIKEYNNNDSPVVIEKKNA